MSLFGELQLTPQRFGDDEERAAPAKVHVTFENSLSLAYPETGGGDDELDEAATAIGPSPAITIIPLTSSPLLSIDRRCQECSSNGQWQQQQGKKQLPLQDFIQNSTMMQLTLFFLIDVDDDRPTAACGDGDDEMMATMIKTTTTTFAERSVKRQQSKVRVTTAFITITHYPPLNRCN